MKYSRAHLKYRGTTLFLLATPSNAILRAVSIAHTPFAPICEIR